jgi:uncharacterized membrane protein YhaH (DUF805 family)
VSFGDAVLSVLRQYATFRGRASRPEFWWWYLCAVLVNIATSLVENAAHDAIGVSLLGTFVGLGLLLPTLAVSVRRLHDSGLSGWWVLAPVGLAVLGFALLFGGFAAIFAPAFTGNGPGSPGLGLALAAVGLLLVLASGVLNLVLMLRRSTPGPNRFGAHPATPSGHPPAGDWSHPSRYSRDPW